jgi:hypothetical protein
MGALKHIVRPKSKPSSHREQTKVIPQNLHVPPCKTLNLLNIKNSQPFRCGWMVVKRYAVDFVPSLDDFVWIWSDNRQGNHSGFYEFNISKLFKMYCAVFLQIISNCVPSCTSAIPSGNQTWQLNIHHLVRWFSIFTLHCCGIFIAMFDCQRVTTILWVSQIAPIGKN